MPDLDLAAHEDGSRVITRRDGRGFGRLRDPPRTRNGVRLYSHHKHIWRLIQEIEARGHEPCLMRPDRGTEAHKRIAELEKSRREKSE